MNVYLSCPPVVRSADLGHAVFLLDEYTGETVLLSADRAAWLEMAATGTTPAPLRPGFADLLARGFLIPTSVPRPWRLDVELPPTEPSWGTQEAPGALPRDERFRLAWALPAAIALATVLTFRATGRRGRSFNRMQWLVTAATRTGRRAATARTTTAALDCVRVLGRFSPFRTACLEETVAAMLALALTGQRAGWCHGIAADPIRLHAWLTVDGTPVGEPISTLQYQPLIRLPEQPPAAR